MFLREIACILSGTVVDCGANIGLFSLYSVAKAAAAGGRVQVRAPSRTTFRSICIHSTPLGMYYTIGAA